MKIRYFPDTDTVYMELTNKEVVDTIDLNENTMVDLDIAGNVVAITLEHAQELANIFEVSFQQVVTSQAREKEKQPVVMS
jgi:uncharacterized protein YuzE